ncbi:enamine deaminase RidA (YjgF/YER057c/UK114 family) [Acinetobacter calcoaceticus]|uniref:Enamine deaminase RidA (YjgF/YER057c/UK114 family) n=1 Tax=Acinetobacter calcoaceticus TaxID=471 RepID=A0A4R1Y3X9_ACICA|nr:enamine deaminase RidA (YjgF/YER057c/UK114 family) [Acinetobacter calcoaceticus]
MKFPNTQQLHSFALVNPEQLFNPRPFAFSHVAEVRHYLRALHISGQGGQNQQGQLSSDFVHQVEQAFRNITFILKDRDATLADIAVLRIYVVEHNSKKHQLLIQAMQRLWQDRAFPACTLVPVNCLALTGMLIEVEATAYCL